MNRTPENNGKTRGLVIEVIGPLVDDRGLLARTYVDILAEVQVVLRPGALEQVAGASIEWTLQTLLEGHGRFDLLDRVPEFVERIRREWDRLVPSGLMRLGAGAGSAWRQITLSDRRVLLLFGGDPATVPVLLDSLELDRNELVAVVGGGPTGLPQPDTITDWLASHNLPADAVNAAVWSPPATLAAGGAGLREICLVGKTASVHSMLPIDATLQSLEAFAGR